MFVVLRRCIPFYFMLTSTRVAAIGSAGVVSVGRVRGPPSPVHEQVPGQIPESLPFLLQYSYQELTKTENSEAVLDSTTVTIAADRDAIARIVA